MQQIGFPKWKYPLWHLHWNPISGVGRTSIDDSKSSQEVNFYSSIPMKIKDKRAKIHNHIKLCK